MASEEVGGLMNESSPKLPRTGLRNYLHFWSLHRSVQLRILLLSRSHLFFNTSSLIHDLPLRAGNMAATLIPDDRYRTTCSASVG